jgi:hypothetical protein
MSHATNVSLLRAVKPGRAKAERQWPRRASKRQARLLGLNSGDWRTLWARLRIYGPCRSKPLIIS